MQFSCFSQKPGLGRVGQKTTGIPEDGYIFVRTWRFAEAMAESFRWSPFLMNIVCYIYVCFPQNEDFTNFSRQDQHFFPLAHSWRVVKHRAGFKSCYVIRCILAAKSMPSTLMGTKKIARTINNAISSD